MKVTDIRTGMSYLKGYRSRKNRLIVRSKKVYNQLKIKYGFDVIKIFNKIPYTNLHSYSSKPPIKLYNWSENIPSLPDYNSGSN